MYIILVHGPSGSGKTTISKLIKKSLPEVKTEIISMDQFYKILDQNDPISNWDTIDAFDTDHLYSCLVQLRYGKTTEIPIYDYVTCTRLKDKQTINGNLDIVIVEGIMTLYDERICTLADLKIYIDADPWKTCLRRRFSRDMEDRGRSYISVLNQYLDQVLDGYLTFVEPMKKKADLCYVNEGEIPNDETLFIKIVCNYILNRIKH